MRLPYVKSWPNYFLLLVFCLLTVRCSNKLKVQSSEVIKPYTEEELALIESHWKQYFKDDIFEELGTKEAVFPIAFDSYGAPYPDFRLFEDFDDDNFAAGLPRKMDRARNIFTLNHSDNDLNKYSMFRIFQWEENADVLEAGIAAIEDTVDRKFYSDLLYDYSQQLGYGGREFSRHSPLYYQYIDSFYARWNRFHFDKLTNRLKAQIDQVRPDNILFFVHGYNVPYGLAAIQSIEIHHYIRELQEQIGKKGTFLLVPIFWSSNDQKKSEFETREKVKMSDEVKLSNAMKWEFYSTRASFAGLGLRKVIHDLEMGSEDLPELYIFSHSLGTAVATTALINTTSKVSGARPSEPVQNDCATPHSSNQWHTNLSLFRLHLGKDLAVFFD